MEIPLGRGVLKAKCLEEMYENKLEFPGGWGSAKQKTFHGGSMYIFWNCTIHISHKSEQEYANDTQVPINQLGLIVNGLYFLHDNIFFNRVCKS